MHYTRSRKVHVTVAQVHGRAQLRKPAAAPNPASEHRIQKRTNEKLANQESPESDAFANRAYDDVSRRLHENHFEERQAIAARIVRRPSHEKSFAAQKTPLPAPNQKMIQGQRAADIRWRSVQCYRAKLKCITDRVISQERKNVSREIQHHQVAGILL